MNFGTKSTNTLTQCLFGLVSLLSRCPSCTGVCPNHRAVYQQPFQVWLFYQLLMHLLPDPFIRPVGEPFENRIPLTKFIRQVPPLDTRSHHPMHRIHERSTFFFVPHIDARYHFQTSVYFVPIWVLYSMSYHGVELGTVLFVSRKSYSNVNRT